MTEEWKWVVGFEDIYEVSSFGNIRSVKRADSRGRIREGLDLRPRLVGRKPQHVRATLHKNARRFEIYLHRIVAEAFIPNPEGLPYVLHWDDDPTNNKVSNLHWGTHAENMREMSERGRHNSPNSLKTECKRGHPYNQENTILKNGRRECRVCKNAKQRERWAKKYDR